MKRELSVTIKFICLAAILALGVVSIIASGGGGGGGGTTDTTAAAGLWHGTMTSADNNTFTIGGLISSDGQLRFVVDEGLCIGTQYISTSFTLNGDAGSGSFTGLTTGECFFENNSTKTSGTFVFTATGDNVTGTYTAGNDSGTFTLTNNHEAEVAITLADLEGNWGYDLAPDYFSHMTISSNGSLTGTDDSGCNYSGQVSIIDPDFSITNVSVTASSCPEPAFNGTYSGLGFLNTALNEFVVLLSNSTFPIFDVLDRLP